MSTLFRAKVPASPRATQPDAPPGSSRNPVASAAETLLAWATYSMRASPRQTTRTMACIPHGQGARPAAPPAPRHLENRVVIS